MEDQVLSTWPSLWARFCSLVGLHDPTPGNSPEFDTAGGPQTLDTPEPSSAPTKTWNTGWLSAAHHTPIHPGRIGGRIKFWGTVVHTTDMHPDRFDALLRAWAKDKGRGAGAHFALGRTPQEGLHQLASIDLNGNHAGGPTHGWIGLPGGKRLHPNAGFLGIEVSCAGLVHKIKGEWRTVAKVNGKPLPFAAPIPAFDVAPITDQLGEHAPTNYQLEMLDYLLTALAEHPGRAKAPAGWEVVPNSAGGKYPAPRWAPLTSIRGMPVVGHITLDPARKRDPHEGISKHLTFAKLPK